MTVLVQLGLPYLMPPLLVNHKALKIAGHSWKIPWSHHIGANTLSICNSSTDWESEKDLARLR